MTYNHIPSYSLGLFLGYLCQKKAKIENKAIVVLGWIASLMLFTLVTYIPVAMGKEPTFNQNLVFAMFQALMMASVFAWMHYACSTGNGGNCELFNKSALS